MQSHYYACERNLPNRSSRTQPAPRPIITTEFNCANESYKKVSGGPTKRSEGVATTKSSARHLIYNIEEITAS
jgi:hypothetical protein